MNDIGLCIDPPDILQTATQPKKSVFQEITNQMADGKYIEKSDDILEEFDTDFNDVRSNLKFLAAKAEDAVKAALANLESGAGLVNNGVSNFSQLIRAANEINKSRLDIHKTRKDIKNISVEQNQQAGPQNVQNVQNNYFGTSKELIEDANKIIEDMRNRRDTKAFVNEEIITTTKINTEEEL